MWYACIRGDTMKILYNQQENPINCCLGIRDCYFKTLSTGKDKKSVTRKLHRHTCFEVHIVAQGCEQYEMGNRRVELLPGEFLLLSPGIPHRLLFSHEKTKKYAVWFQADIALPDSWFSSTVPAEVRGRIARIEQESPAQTESARFLIANAVFEIVLLFLRQAGMTEKTTPPCNETHTISAMAKQYISDNIDSAPTVAEVAAYCSISTKQLSRIFAADMELTPCEYIKKQQIQRITKLLGSTDLSLAEISEKMHFSSVYYFHAFFKKSMGIPPGEYRKMYKSQ